VHVFGHTHFGWDATLDGIRYIQAPVSYPHEWKQRPTSLTVGPDTRGAEFNLVGRTLDAPLCILDARPDSGGVGNQSEGAAGVGESVAGGSGGGGGGGGGGFGFVGEMRARWSDHYNSNPREPDILELAWWVEKYLNKGLKP
jgi:hypothetical protein